MHQINFINAVLFLLGKVLWVEKVMITCYSEYFQFLSKSLLAGHCRDISDIYALINRDIER